MKARTLLSGALALAALGIAGCGGGGDDSETSAPSVATTPTTTALTKEELIAQGDAICAEVNAAIGSVSSAGTDSASLVAQEADLYGGMVERLKGLGMPDDTAGYEELIGAADALAQAENDAALAAARGDTTALQAAESEASTALASFQSAAQSYGFEACGEAPSAPVATAPGTTTPGGAEVPEEVEEEVAPEVEPEPEPEVAPEAGGAEAGGGAATGGGTAGGGTEESGGGSSGGIGPG